MDGVSLSSGFDDIWWLLHVEEPADAASSLIGVVSGVSRHEGRFSKKVAACEEEPYLHVTTKRDLLFEGDCICISLLMSHWLAPVPSKRWCEGFFLLYSILWILLVLVVVAFRLYENFRKMDYVWLGLVVGLPCFLLPFCLQPRSELEKPFSQRYWVKANVWIAIFSFIGNYFWTHYFYQVLGASYTMKTHDLNQVPICTYFLTHAYFCLYHTFSNILIRKIRSSLAKTGKTGQFLGESVVVFLFSYFAAYMETYTIEEFPYYTFVDRKAMYGLGSLFYAIYFFVSFPLFYRMDEDPSEPRWTLGQAAMNSLGAGMLVTILLDLWRLALGPVVDIGPEHRAHGPPWLMATRNSRY